MNYLEKYNSWLNDSIFDEVTKKELLAIKDNNKEIEDRFYKDLEFGTGGLRGVVGAGTNRMNKYTVTKATQGLANYIKKCGGENNGVAIAYDSRHMSQEFSIWTALCLNANGIKTYRFESLRPTPELSYTVRKLNCIAGVVITASHNPAEYNGYKVYFEDGAQITFPRDKEIIDEVNKITSYNNIQMMDIFDAKKNDLYHEIGKDIDDSYIAELKKLILNQDVIDKVGKQLKIVYTPLHGTGNLLVRRVLKELGFENVYIVKEQEMPNGDFPTVNYPNPEDPNAFKLALELAKKVNADLVLATDPDSDRLGIYAKNKDGVYESFTGNMSALLIAEYRLSQMKKQNILPSNGAIVTTIVSSDMAKPIANKYNLKLIETLTGFKYIGEQIKFFDEKQDYKYVFGFEESYGCLIGTYARDKDAISAVMALCEAAAYYYSKNLTLCDQMEKLYKEYGYYKESLLSVTLKGIDGSKKINHIMDKLRKNPLKEFAGYKVNAIRDYKKRIVNYTNGVSQKTNLPISNVIYYELENDAWICIRPSGTEPKIKFYFGVKESTLKKSNQRILSIIDYINKSIIN